jgi:hypothetical protein
VCFHFIPWSDFGASYTWGVKLGVSSNICVPKDLGNFDTSMLNN